jgi:hypothetical protein
LFAALRHCTFSISFNLSLFPHYSLWSKLDLNYNSTLAKGLGLKLLAYVIVMQFPHKHPLERREMRSPVCTRRDNVVRNKYHRLLLLPFYSTVKGAKRLFNCVIGCLVSFFPLFLGMLSCSLCY